MIKNYFTISTIIVLLSLLNISGCDIDLIPADSNESVDNNEEIKGTIISVIPSRGSGVENIGVKITNDDNFSYSTQTNGSGYFRIEDNVEGSLELEFTDPEDNDKSLGKIFLNILPGAKMNLGNITLNNNHIQFEDDKFEVKLTGDLIEIDCDENYGSIEVEIKGENEDVNVLVQLKDSTDIEKGDGEDANCEDFLTGQVLEIDGELITNNSIDADRIVIQ